MLRPLLCLLIAALQVLAAPAGARGRPAYRTQGLCDGYPRAALTTPQGMCVGLVASRLGFPRGLALIGSDVYLTDLASRTPGRGRVLRLGGYGRERLQVVLDRLDLPNGILADDQGRLLVGEVGRVIRFDPRAPEPRATVQTVVAGLPTDGLHVLTSLAFASDGALLVSTGSATNNCEGDGGVTPDPGVACPELRQSPPRAAVLRVPLGAGLPVQANAAEVLARGLRNVTGIARVGPRMLAVVNGRDAISEADPKLPDAALPHDLLVDLARAGGDFGWPYCFDRARPSPEYTRHDCSRYRAPYALLPAHSAPLAIISYAGSVLPALRGKAIVALHGYRANGHRLVALDSNGPRPVVTPLVTGWARQSGVRPQGAPAALLELPDGSILIAEDLNRILLRLSADR